MIGYFVTVVRDKRVFWALGPFATHAEALSRVHEVKDYCIKNDPWCEFDAFGTSSTDAKIEGKLNLQLSQGCAKL